MVAILKKRHTFPFWKFVYVTVTCLMLLPKQRRDFLKTTALTGLGLALHPTLFASSLRKDMVRIGMIGLDTSHCEAFTKVINGPTAGSEYAGFRVTAAYPYGSKDIESSASRIPKITEDIKKYNVKITASIDELLKETDVILLETNDGRLHKEQALQVIRAGKKLFIDKPVAARLQDAADIFKALHNRKNTPRSFLVWHSRCGSTIHYYGKELQKRCSIIPGRNRCGYRHMEGWPYWHFQGNEKRQS
jgi:predicted dehydrogenase